MSERPKHPSGKPIRRSGEVRLGFYRRVPEEPLTPGLRRQSPTAAIGFNVHLLSSEVDDD